MIDDNKIYTLKNALPDYSIFDTDKKAKLLYPTLG